MRTLSAKPCVVVAIAPRSIATLGTAPSPWGTFCAPALAERSKLKTFAVQPENAIQSMEMASAVDHVMLIFVASNETNVHSFRMVLGLIVDRKSTRLNSSH